MTPNPAEADGPARTLVLLRHAKSDWPEDVADHDRPLAPRGRADAPAVGAWLAKRGLHPDRVVVSDARRAVQTWELAAEALSADRAPDVHVEPRAYGASARALLDLVHETPSDVRTLLLIGHNPGMARLAAELDDLDPSAGELRARMQAKYPTSAVAVLTVTRPWAGLEPGEARLTAFAAPRG